MQLKTVTHTFRTEILPGILNSYSIIFFLDNKILAGTIMLVSFFNFWAGFSGLSAVVFTILVGNAMHLNKFTLRSGVYSFNSLLVGIGMGTFFDPGIVYFSLLAIVTLFTLFLSVTLGGQLFKLNLPFLSIPFVLAFWFVVLPSSNFENLGLTQRNIFWINEMYSMGGNPLLILFQTIDNMEINKLVDIYLRSISSIFFQNNLISGALITIALLYSSRIMFSLSIVGFLSAYIFAYFTGSEAASINYYNIGANYMMVAFAVGGFFLIPSKQSYLWTILLIPLTSLVLMFFYKLFSYIQLPVFSFPFAFTVIMFIYFLQLRTKAKSLILTPLQHNSPEINLYTFKNNKDRLNGLYYFPLHLPLMGEWTVTQAHDGEYTHIGEWGKAYDFMITDSHSKTY
ncbi:MAG TPA: urea transporter, partial [Paludibacter sp.]|nr:urea transporter [Paludibacter sp.]